MTARPTGYSAAVCECGDHHARHVGLERDRPQAHCLDCGCNASTVLASHPVPDTEESA